MRKQKLDVYQRQWLTSNNEYQWSSLVKEQYSNVSEIILEMSFKDYDGRGDPKPQQMNFLPDSKGYFKIKCPLVECISGGFDLSSAISEVIKQTGDKSSGNLVCQGWQDKERVNKNKCRLELNYTIYIKYKINQ